MGVETRSLAEDDIQQVEFRQLGEGQWRSQESIDSNIFPRNIFNMASNAEIEIYGEPEDEEITVHKYLENGASRFEAVNEDEEKVMDARVNEIDSVDPIPLKTLLEEEELERLEYLANDSYNWEEFSGKAYFHGIETEEILAGEIRDEEGKVVYKLNADKAENYDLQDVYTLPAEVGVAYMKAMNTSLEALLLPSKMAMNITASILPEKENRE